MREKETTKTTCGKDEGFHFEALSYSNGSRWGLSFEQFEEL